MMASAPALQTPLAPTTADDVELVGYVRFRSCPRCGARGRALTDTGGSITARCLGCGDALAGGLATERHARLAIVGRGGQADRPR